MAQQFIDELLQHGKAELPIDYRFVVQMTTLLYYDEYFLGQIHDSEIRYKMIQLKNQVDDKFEERIDEMIDKFNENLLEDDRLENYEEDLTKDNLLGNLVDNIKKLLIITSKAKVAPAFGIESNLTLYSGLGYLGDCDKLMFENLLYLNKIGKGAPMEWITPTFLSTTHSIDTAVRFTGRMREDPDVRDILRITV